MALIAVLLLGAVSFAQGYDKFFTIGPCTATVQTDATIDFKQVAEDNNGIWSYMMVPDTSKNQNLESMSVDFAETETAGKYIMTVYEQQTGEKPRKRLPITLNDAGSGHASLEATIDGKNTELKMSVILYVKNKVILYYLCSEFGGDIKQDYVYVLAHEELDDDTKGKIYALIKKYGLNGPLKSIKKYTPQ